MQCGYMLNFRVEKIERECCTEREQERGRKKEISNKWTLM